MTEPAARFSTGSDLFDAWRDDLLSGTPPVRYPVGTGDLARVEIGPGLVTLIGGAPGAGKTALIMQLVLDGLRLTPALRALVCNIEMPPAVLLDRQLARIAGVDLNAIRSRTLKPEHGEATTTGLDALANVVDRLAFVRPPFDLDNVAKSADAFDADLIVLDYIQRIRPPGKHADARAAVSTTMSAVRQFADAGLAVIVVAALARGRDDEGRSSYTEGLSLASFRESSELEYGADDAFILAPDGGPASSRVVLMHLKSRYGECRDVTLDFDRPRQRFTANSTGPGPTSAAGKPALNAKIQAAWDAQGTRP